MARELALRFWAHHPAEEPPALDMDADSEEELDDLAWEVCQRQPDPLHGRAGAGWQRFSLLKRLWRDYAPTPPALGSSDSFGPGGARGGLRGAYRNR